VEYPELEEQMKAIGAMPTSTWSDGSPKYTLPTLIFTTGEVMSGSVEIIEALDAMYPDTPRLLAEDTKSDQLIRAERLGSLIDQPAYLALVHGISKRVLNDSSMEYWDRTRLRELPSDSPLGSTQRQEMWKNVETGLDKINTEKDSGWISSTLGKSGRLLYSDIVLLALLYWPRYSLEEEEYSKYLEWNGGRWKELLDMYSKYFG
jgi:glutathione S-transferase